MIHSARARYPEQTFLVADACHLLDAIEKIDEMIVRPRGERVALES